MCRGLTSFASLAPAHVLFRAEQPAAPASASRLRVPEPHVRAATLRTRRTLRALLLGVRTGYQSQRTAGQLLRDRSVCPLQPGTATAVLMRC